MNVYCQETYGKNSIKKKKKKEFLFLKNAETQTHAHPHPGFYVMGISEETRMNIRKCLILRTIALCRRGCMVAGRPVEQSRSATLPLIFGTVLRRRKRKSFHTG